MAIPAQTLILIAVILWISAIAMFVIGMLMPEPISMFRWVAIPEAIAATAFTALAIRKSSK